MQRESRHRRTPAASGVRLRGRQCPLPQAAIALSLGLMGCSNLLQTDAAPAQGRLTVQVADAALAAGAPDMALRVADLILRESPRNVPALVAKGDALYAMGHLDLARGAYRSAIEVDSGSVGGLIGLGRTLVRGNPKAAEAAFLDAATRQPGNVTALSNLGIARDLQGRHETAQEAYRRALAAAPEAADIKVNLGLSLALSGRSDEALALLRPLAEQPDLAGLPRNDLAAALALAGDPAESRRVLRNELAPSDADTWATDTASAEPPLVAVDSPARGPVSSPAGAPPAGAAPAALFAAGASPARGTVVPPAGAAPAAPLDIRTAPVVPVLRVADGRPARQPAIVAAAPIAAPPIAQPPTAATSAPQPPPAAATPTEPHHAAPSTIAAAPIAEPVTAAPSSPHPAAAAMAPIEPHRAAPMTVAAAPIAEPSTAGPSAPHLAAAAVASTEPHHAAPMTVAASAIAEPVTAAPSAPRQTPAAVAPPERHDAAPMIVAAAAVAEPVTAAPSAAHPVPAAVALPEPHDTTALTVAAASIAAPPSVTPSAAHPAPATVALPEPHETTPASVAAAQMAEPPAALHHPAAPHHPVAVRPYGSADPASAAPTVVVAALSMPPHASVRLAPDAPAATSHAPATLAVTTPQPAPSERKPELFAQLAALDSAERAKWEWQHLQSRLCGLLDGRTPEIVSAEVHGRTFWRLRTGGFRTMTEQSAFCSQVRGLGLECW